MARCVGRASLLFDVDGTFMGEAEDEMPPTRLPCELVALPCSDELGASSEGEGEGEGGGGGEGEGGSEGGADGEAEGSASVHDEALMAPQPDIPIGARVSHPSLGVGEIVEKKKARQLGQIHGSTVLALPRAAALRTTASCPRLVALQHPRAITQPRAPT